MPYTSDEAILFADIHNAMSDEHKRLRSHTDDALEAVDTILDSSFPDYVSEEKFWEWVHDQKSAQRTVQKLYTTQEYIDTIEHTTFNDASSVGALCRVINNPMHGYIPVGTYSGYRYRLSPCSTHLAVDESDVNWRDDHEFMDESVIGISLVGQKIRHSDPAKDRTAQKRTDGTDESYFTDSSSKSIQLNDSTGFVCFQIGMVEAAPASKWSEDGELPAEKRENDIAWEKTLWVMVLVVDADNKAGDVWLLYDFNPMTEGGVYITPDNDLTWGYFPGAKGEMPKAAVKIANTFRELCTLDTWTMDEYIMRRYDLVIAVIAERDEAKGLSSHVVRQLPEPEIPDMSSLGV